MKTINPERAAIILEDLASEVRNRHAIPTWMQKEIFEMADYFGFAVDDLRDESIEEKA